MKPRISAIMTCAALLLAAVPSYARQLTAPEVSPLMEMMQKGTPSELKTQITDGFDVNKCDADGNSPLLLAAVNRRSDLMYILLENGADPNFVKEPGVTALGIACMFDDWSMIDLLITHGADVNYCAPNGESTLSMACAQGAVNAVQMLLAGKAKTDVRDAAGITPLLHAVMHNTENSLSIARMLLEKGANVDFGMPNGFTPLMGAVQMNDMDIALLLLEHGADVNARQTSGPSALSIAVALGHAEMAGLLLANKADISVGINAQTSLIAYASMLARADVMAELLKHGANANTRDARSNATPLHVTATGNALIIDSIKLMGAASLLPTHESKMDAAMACKVLLENGAEVNAVDNDGTTPAMIAAMDGSPDTLKVLIDHGANLNMADAAGRTPLILAVLSPEEKAAISLAHVTPAVAEQVKPQVTASMTEYPDVINTVKLLLQAGVDITAKDKSGKTARDYATDPEVIRLLDEASAK
ncbi:MAG: ankyrin repeat domain-containing protein [Akkermansia sp.]|nr:ankyrin repeat domain-containing protein [Akkermansia sp.]